MLLKPDYVKYVGLTLGDLPLAALTFTKYPEYIGDLPADFANHSDFETSTANPSFKAHTQVGIGLLGFKIPATPKSPSNVKYYGLTIADVPVAAVVVKKNPRIIGDLPADFSNSTLAENATKSIPAHNSVAFGLLGIKIPLRK
jgi:hypothetical protein